MAKHLFLTWPITIIFLFMVSVIFGHQISAAFASEEITEPENPLKISIYYETLCPDSLNLLENQLLDILSPKEDSGFQRGIEALVDIQLIPYGKALTLESSSQSDKFSFICQHGPVECQGNKLHSCVIKSATKARGIRSQNLVKLLTCSMKFLMASPGSEPPSLSTNLTSKILPAFKFCFLEFELTTNPENPDLISIKSEVESCLEDGEGSSLLKVNGDLTERLSPKLYFVPWVTFNGVWNRRLMDGSLKDLRKVLCQLVIQTSALASGSPLQNTYGCEKYYYLNPGGPLRPNPNPIVDDRISIDGRPSPVSIKVPAQGPLANANEMGLLLPPLFDESPEMRTRDGREVLKGVGGSQRVGKDRRRFIHPELETSKALGGWRVQGYPITRDWRWRRPIVR